MTNSEKDFVNTLARKIIELQETQLRDFLHLDGQITKLYILIILQSITLFLITIL